MQIFDSLTALISVLDANGGTDAPGQSAVGPLTGGFVVWHSNATCLMADSAAKHKLIFNRLLGFPRTAEILQAYTQGQRNKVSHECFTKRTGEDVFT